MASDCGILLGTGGTTIGETCSAPGHVALPSVVVLEISDKIRRACAKGDPKTSGSMASSIVQSDPNWS